MRTSELHRIRNAVLVALLLLGGGILANMYMNESVSLNGEAVSVSREQNAGVLKSVFEVFDPSLRSFLASVPIVLDPSADTARAYPEKATNPSTTT